MQRRAPPPVVAREEPALPKVDVIHHVAVMGREPARGTQCYLIGSDRLLRMAMARILPYRGRFRAAVRLAVIGMGKCGARELNYVSDVDVIFLAAPRDRKSVV